MLKAIQRWSRSLWVIIVSSLGNNPPPPKPDPAPEPARLPVPAPGDLRSARYERIKNGDTRSDLDAGDSPKDNFGSLYFRDNILHNLDSYFDDLRRLRAYDPNSYELYSKFGAQLTTKNTVLQREIEPAWLKDRPTFGATYIGDTQEEIDEYNKRHKLDGRHRLLPLKMMYYVKTSRLTEGVECARPDEDTYETMYFVHGRKQRGIRPYYVAVDQVGNVRVLRQKAYYNRWNKGMRDLKPEDWILTAHSPEEHIRNCFGILTSVTINATAGIQILVNKGSLTARFNIDMLRTPYFFKDREKITGDTGKTKKIFHITRAHERFVNGKRVVVPTHFRGLRDFQWGGYSVHISVPGYHHLVAQELDITTENLPEGKPVPKGSKNLHEIVPILLDESRVLH